MGVITITSRSGAEGAKVGGGLEDELEAGVRPRIPPTFSNMMVTMSWSMMMMMETMRITIMTMTNIKIIRWRLGILYIDHSDGDHY